MQTAISKLNSGKAADELGIKAEVLKNAPDVYGPILLHLFNECLKQGIIPTHFKSGILTSIPKKGKPPEVADNHRGLTITAIPGKVLEHMLKLRYDKVLLQNQSSLQFGFTQGLTPGLASLLITEAAAEAHELGHQCTSAHWTPERHLTLCHMNP